MNDPLESTEFESASPEAPTAAPCSLSCSLNRRHFLQALAAGIGVVALSGCSASESGEKTRKIVAVAAGSEWKIPDGAELKPGQALAFEFPDQTPGLVFVTAAGVLRALSARCTHTGCTVLWQNSSELLCPCHGSRFDLSGKVLTGPAEAPLPAYSARKQGSDLLIKPVK